MGSERRNQDGHPRHACPSTWYKGRIRDGTQLYDIIERVYFLLGLHATNISLHGLPFRLSCRKKISDMSLRFRVNDALMRRNASERTNVASELEGRQKNPTHNICDPAVSLKLVPGELARFVPRLGVLDVLGAP